MVIGRYAWLYAWLWGYHGYLVLVVNTVVLINCVTLHIFQRFENVLKSWDASLQWERDKKFHNLQQRVRIQRELITKNNQLSDQLRKKAEDEQIDVSKGFLFAWYAYYTAFIASYVETPSKETGSERND